MATALAIVVVLGAALVWVLARNMAAIRRSEERYARALQASNDGIWEWNPLTDDLFMSERARQLYAVPDSAIVRTRSELMRVGGFHPDDRPMIDTTVASLHSGPHADDAEFDMEYRVIHRGGDVRWVRSQGKAFPGGDGRIARVTGALTDITDRKRAELGLRESEQRYALAMEAAADGHMDWNFATGEFYLSPRMLQIVGHPQDATFADRADWVRRFPFHPDDRKRWEEAIAAHFASPKAIFKMEVRIVVNGETRWLAFNFIATRDSAGKVVRWTGSIAEIHDEKRDVAAVVKSIPGLVAILTPAGEVDATNDHLVAYCGQPLEAMRQWRANGIVHPADVPRVGEIFVPAISTGQPYVVEARIRRFDGAYRWNLIRGHPVRDAGGTIVRWYSVLTDIDDRKLAEEALRESEKRYERAMVASRAGYWDWDVVKDDYYLSPAMLELAGFPPDTRFSGRDDFIRRVSFCTQQERESYQQAVREVIAARGTRMAKEVRLMVDGEIRWINMEGLCVRDAAGKVTRWTGFATDVTQRKRAEEELRKMEERLRLAQRLESMGTLAGGIAHDFNNILGAIVGYGEMALRGVKKGSRQHRDLDAIMAAGERGRALVDRILAFSRSGVGERAPVNVESVVREALGQVAAKLPDSIATKLRLRAGRAAMLGDSTQVHQVVMNLAWNAVHAMPQGGTLRVDLRTEHFDYERPAMVGSIAPGDYIVLGVSDTGTGIAPEVLERMFDPFFTTKEVGVGSGLGLSLVHGIVTGVGGAIDVATEVGNGSTFTVYLPRTGEAVQDRADEERPLPRGDGQRVLVVDDEQSLARLAGETLEDLGYAPITFTSSALALQAFDSDPGGFDAILTDERMPGVTGSALIREVRRINPSIPIVLMSGFIGTDDPRELGADDVLRKPLHARDLAASLARVLQTR